MYIYEEKPIQRVKTYIVHDFVRKTDKRKEYTESNIPKDQILWENARDIQEYMIEKSLGKGKREQNRAIGNILVSDADESKFFNKEDIGKEEPLIFVGHGVEVLKGTQEHKLLFGVNGADGTKGYTASQLAVVVRGLLPDGYSGMIYLDGCHTGEKLFENKKKSFVDYFAMELGKDTRLGNFVVKGNIGAAHTEGKDRSSGQESSVEPGEYVKITKENVQQFIDNIREIIRELPGEEQGIKYKKFDNWYHEFYEKHSGSPRDMIDIKGRLKDYNFPVFEDLFAFSDYAKASTLYVKGKAVRHFTTRDSAMKDGSIEGQGPTVSERPTALIDIGKKPGNLVKPKVPGPGRAVNPAVFKPPFISSGSSKIPWGAFRPIEKSDTRWPTRRLGETDSFPFLTK